MYNINPVQIWVNGQRVIVSKFETYGVGDNLINGIQGVAKFYWALGVPVDTEGQDDSVNWVITGNVTMSGTDYNNWDDSNEAAVAFVADQLNVSLTN